jgi:hypothetical protein
LPDLKIKASLKLKERYKGVFVKHTLSLGVGLLGLKPKLGLVGWAD